jgi:uncharacterized protein YxeA
MKKYWWIIIIVIIVAIAGYVIWQKKQKHRKITSVPKMKPVGVGTKKPEPDQNKEFVKGQGALRVESQQPASPYPSYINPRT